MSVWLSPSAWKTCSRAGIRSDSSGARPAQCLSDGAVVLGLPPALAVCHSPRGFASMTTALDAALAYSAFCGVIPCSASKTPIRIEGVFERGFADATTDPAVITQTWTHHNADIGIAPPPGVVVVDVDVPNGKKGREDFVRLFGCAPDEMETPVATTPRGGWHVYFGYDQSLQLVQRSITESIDIRVGGKGYVIAPSPGNGRRWVRPLLTTPLLEAPAWLIEQLKERAKPEAAREPTPCTGETTERAQETLRSACAALAGAAPGTRDATIARVVYRVGRLAGAGEVESGSALDALLAAIAANPGTDKGHRAKVERCFSDGSRNPAEPGPIDDRNAIEDDFGVEDHGDRRVGDGVVDRQEEGASEHASSAPSGWDTVDVDLFLAGSDLPPPELSDDALPEGWAEIIRANAAVAEAPPDYVAITAIAGAAGAIGNAYVVEGKHGWREPAVLWAMLIGPPSAHKTPAMKAAHNALAAIDHDLYVAWKKECEEIEVQHQMALDSKAAANQPKKSVKKPEKPPLQHLLHDDTSLEKLTINMAASPHGAVAFYSELAAWFASFSRYSSGGDDSSGRALWNRAYDAERFKRDRVKNEGPPIVVPAAACSVVGAIQPDLLRRIWPKSHDGLLARPIYVWPRLAPLPSVGSENDDDDIAGGEAHAVRKAFNALHDLPLVLDHDNVHRPVVLRLASEARTPFSIVKRDCERRARREPGLVGEWLGKSPGRILRLALIFQLMTWSLTGDAPPKAIGLDPLDRAIRYFHYAEGMLLRTLEGLEPTRSAEDALAVARQIVRIGWTRFTNHDVGREHGFRWFRGEEAGHKRRRDNALNVLIDARVIRKDIVATGRGTVEKWAVNPELEDAIRGL